MVGSLGNRLDAPAPQKIFHAPLELFSALTILMVAADKAVGVPIGAPDMRRAPEGVRCQLVPNLLFGGFGYEV